MCACVRARVCVSLGIISTTITLYTCHEQVVQAELKIIIIIIIPITVTCFYIPPFQLHSMCQGGLKTVTDLKAGIRSLFDIM